MFEKCTEIEELLNTKDYWTGTLRLGVKYQKYPIKIQISQSYLLTNSAVRKIDKNRVYNVGILFIRQIYNYEYVIYYFACHLISWFDKQLTANNVIHIH